MSAALAGMAAEVGGRGGDDTVRVSGWRDGRLVTEAWPAAAATREALAAADMWLVRSLPRSSVAAVKVLQPAAPAGALPAIPTFSAAGPAPHGEGDPGGGKGGGGKGGGGKGGKDEKPPRGSVEIAQAAMDAYHLIADDGGQVHLWNGQHWGGLTPHGALALAFDVGSRGNSNGRSEVVKYWQAAAFVPGEVWLRAGMNEVPLGNGVLNIETGNMRPHDPDDYLDRVIPHNYDPTAGCDFWMECLERYFGDLTDDRVTALQEFAGYLLTSHAKYKKALFLFGPSGTGKSRIIEALTSLVGKKYMCSIPLEMLDDPKRVAMIKGKSLNVVTELPDGALIKDGAFKSLVSTEEPVMLDEKYKRVETYTPTAKFVIATNTLPAIADRSDATFARLLIVNMDRPVPKSDTRAALEVDEKIAAEAPGVINWALEGLRRLYTGQGVFTEPASSRELIQGYRLEQNPLEQFIAERCRRAVSGPNIRRRGITTDRFVTEFNAWHKGGRPWSKTRVARTLNTMAIDGVEIVPVKWHGVAVKTVVGLELVPLGELPAELEVDATGDGHEIARPAKDEREAVGPDPAPASDERAV